MSSWICDGVPKDGKDYSGLGGQHEPISNDFPDCQYCGLPQEAMNLARSGDKTKIINRSGNNSKFILLGVFAGVLLLIGGGVAYFRIWVAIAIFKPMKKL